MYGKCHTILALSLAFVIAFRPPRKVVPDLPLEVAISHWRDEGVTEFRKGVSPAAPRRLLNNTGGFPNTGDSSTCDLIHKTSFNT